MTKEAFNTVPASLPIQDELFMQDALMADPQAIPPSQRDQNQKGGFDHASWGQLTEAQQTTTNEGLQRIRDAIADGKTQRGK